MNRRPRRSRVRAGLAGSLVLGVLAGACHTPDPGKTRADAGVVAFFKDTAFATGPLWRAGSPRDYRFLLRVACFCPGVRGWLLMEVRSDRPLRAWDRTGNAVALTDWNTLSIDGLFDNLERSADRDGLVQVAFDPRWHFPAYVRTVALPGPDAWAIIEARGLRPI